VLDLGAGNGWYLRELVDQFDHVEAVGIDTMAPAIETARQKTRQAGHQRRLEFQVDDIFDFEATDPFDVVVMNRTLHHVWSRRQDLASTLDTAIAADGQLVVWEPAWPQDREDLRSARLRGLGLRNLMEHAMGNSLLTPANITGWLEGLGLTVEVRPIDPVETIFVARRA
jgi:2-polyprenyl-3-methyl-5-hydroxy-6-metoxy-1,4-benzoquinol methylase